MVQKLAVVAAIVALLFSRLSHGLWTASEQNVEAIQEAASKLDRLPMTIGPWQGKKLPDLDGAVVAQAELAGYVWRGYRQRLTGDSVSVLLVCGPVEPVLLHSPDVCYRGIGYDLIGQPEVCTVQPPSLLEPAQFWTARFRKTKAAVPEQMRIYWSWNGKGNWEAVDGPRRAFAHLPVLYKLYVLSEAVHLEGEAPPEKDPCKEFLDLVVPALRKTLAEDQTNTP